MADLSPLQSLKYSLIFNSRSSLECAAHCHSHPSGDCKMIHWDPLNGLCKIGTLDPLLVEIDADGIEIRALGPFEPGELDYI